MKKRLFALSMAVFMALMLVPSSALAAQEAAPAEAAEVEITILHINDSHARIADSDTSIGFAVIAELADEFRKENPNTILLDAGDTLHGLPFVNASKGQEVLELMQTMGFVATVPGNHDFNYGYKTLLNYAQKYQVPTILNANVTYSNGKGVFTPYMIKEVGGVKVGIFGLSTPETLYKTHPDNTRGLRFANSAATAKNMVSALKKEGADVIVCLSHLGIDEASKVTSKLLAQRVSGIDVIIDGHSHTTLPEGMRVKDTLIAQTGCYTENLGVVKIKVSGGKVESKSATLITKEDVVDIKGDPVIAGRVSKLQDVFAKQNKTVLAKSDVRLVGEREVVRAGYSNLGNLVASAMMKAGGSDMAITNGGGLRVSIEAGDVTKANVLEVLPFGNLLMVKAITGENIIAALENGFKSYPELSGGFPQVAGVTFDVDASKPAGSRISNVKIDGKAILKNKTYTVATNDFMASGGDGYTTLMGISVLELGSLDDIVAAHIANGGLADATDVAPYTLLTAAQKAA